MQNDVCAPDVAADVRQTFCPPYVYNFADCGSDSIFVPAVHTAGKCIQWLADHESRKGDRRLGAVSRRFPLDEDGQAAFFNCEHDLQR